MSDKPQQDDEEQDDPPAANEEEDPPALPEIIGVAGDLADLETAHNQRLLRELMEKDEG